MSACACVCATPTAAALLLPLLAVFAVCLSKNETKVKWGLCESPRPDSTQKYTSLRYSYNNKSTTAASNSSTVTAASMCTSTGRVTAAALF